MNENKILDKLSCLGWDLQEELNGDVEKYKQARVEMDRIENAQAELWLRLVGKRRRGTKTTPSNSRRPAAYSTAASPPTR